MASNEKDRRRQRKLRRTFGDKPGAAERSIIPESPRLEPDIEHVIAAASPSVEEQEDATVHEVTEEPQIEATTPSLDTDGQEKSYPHFDLTEDAHDIERDNGIEKLVDAGRLPISRIFAETGKGKLYFVWILPMDVNNVGIIDGNPMDGYKAITKDGSTVASCPMFDFTLEQHKRFDQRFNAYYNATHPEQPQASE